MSDENKNIARRLMEEGWNMGREQVVDQLVSPKCRFHDPVFPSLTSGAENYRQHMRTCKDAFPDLKFTINEIIADMRCIKPGWYAMDDRGNLSSGPCFSREECLRRIRLRMNEATLPLNVHDRNGSNSLRMTDRRLRVARPEHQSGQPSKG